MKFQSQVDIHGRQTMTEFDDITHVGGFPIGPSKIENHF